MSTYELHLFLATNKHRVGGHLTIGISRLPVVMMVKMLYKGWKIKDLKRKWPQVKHEDWVAINRLYKDLKEYKLLAQSK